MDYETSDGSQFSLREVWLEQDAESIFAYTSVSAYVDGSAYVGKLPTPLDEVDDADVLSCLQPVPHDCIHPRFPEGFTITQDLYSTEHYLKAPSYTYDDCRPGKTFVADCVLNETSVLERLKVHPHSNIVTYLGCGVKDGRITHICLERYPSSLMAMAEHGFNAYQRNQIAAGVRAGINHLHELGLAHNDINPGNICMTADGEPVIIDFDGCLPFGERLLKGVSMVDDPKDGFPISSQDNDLICGIDMIQDFVNDLSNQKGNVEESADERSGY